MREVQQEVEGGRHWGVQVRGKVLQPPQARSRVHVRLQEGAAEEAEEAAGRDEWQ